MTIVYRNVFVSQALLWMINDKITRDFWCMYKDSKYGIQTITLKFCHMCYDNSFANKAILLFYKFVTSNQSYNQTQVCELNVCSIKALGTTLQFLAREWTTFQIIILCVSFNLSSLV